jgi:hypothetical protein
VGVGGDGLDQRADADQRGRGHERHGPAGTAGVEERSHVAIIARDRCESAENL